MTPIVSLRWWCDLEFLSDDDTNNYGYVGRAVSYFLDSSLEDFVSQGVQIPSANKWALSVSAVLVPTLGIFEGQYHASHDDWVWRYWDNGSSTLPTLAWEGHDEGDTSPNAKTSAWSGTGTYTKITTEEAAKYLGMDVADMTPATCSAEYEASWNATNAPDPIDTKTTPLEKKNYCSVLLRLKKVWFLLKKTSLNLKPTTRNSKPTTRNYCCVLLLLKRVLLLLVLKIPVVVSPRKNKRNKSKRNNEKRKDKYWVRVVIYQSISNPLLW